MDYVDDAKVLLKRMEKNEIGLKRASFYIAYALYYEKHRKLEEAEKMYHTGVQILAEPINELHKSYDQFLQRVELYKKRKLKMQERRGKTESGHATLRKGEGTSEDPSSNMGPRKRDKPRPETKVRTKTRSTKTVTHTHSNNLNRFNSENTIMVHKFVDSAIVGKSLAETSCHNGLLEPTITTEEAMHAINSMFQEPLDVDPAMRKSHKSKGNKTQNKENGGFEILADEEERPCKSNKHPGNPKPFLGNFTILLDEEEEQKILNENSEIISHGLKEDTVMIRKFVGSTISEEPKVENACHHGLVDPTMNLKEAMDEINSMFRKPMDVPKGEKPKRGQRIALVEKKPVVDNSFFILPDGELEENANLTSNPNNITEGEKPKVMQNSPLVGEKSANGVGFSNSVTEVKSNPTCKDVEGGEDGDGLFEPTYFTRQAMDDINEMFGKDINF